MRPKRPREKRRPQRESATSFVFSSVTLSPALLHTSVDIQPLQQRAHAGPRQGNRAIGSAVVEVNRVAIPIHGVPAREDHVVDVTVALVICLRPEDPRIPPQQAFLWRLKIKEGQP